MAEILLFQATPSLKNNSNHNSQIIFLGVLDGLWRSSPKVVSCPIYETTEIGKKTEENKYFIGIVAILMQLNTFQMVLATDEKWTFSIFNYAALNWTTSTAAGGFRGFGGKQSAIVSKIKCVSWNSQLLEPMPPWIRGSFVTTILRHPGHRTLIGCWELGGRGLVRLNSKATVRLRL